MADGVRWPIPTQKEETLSWKAGCNMGRFTVGVLSKLWAEWLNTAVVYNLKTLSNAVDNREPGQPLITVCNHISCVDDPLIFGVLNLKTLTINTHKLRWVPAAHDICFKKTWHSWFFTRGRVVPIVRGGGVYQKCMNFLVDKLNEGEWVHTFPEGRINFNNESIRFKWGVGRLIADCTRTPLVIPMWHVGTDSILPNRRPYIPQIGETFTLVIGDPIDFSAQLQKLREAKKSPAEIRKALTDRIQDECMVLKEKAERLHNSRKSKLESAMKKPDS